LYQALMRIKHPQPSIHRNISTIREVWMNSLQICARTAQLCFIRKRAYCLSQRNQPDHSPHRVLSVQLSTSIYRVIRSHWQRFVTVWMRQTQRDVPSCCSSTSTMNTLTHGDYPYRQRTVCLRFSSCRLDTHHTPLRRCSRGAVLDNAFTSSRALATFGHLLKRPIEDLPGTARGLSAGPGYAPNSTAPH
jgi:hypothetical protein